MCPNTTNTVTFNPAADGLICSIDASCSGVSCCMNIPRLNRSLEVSMVIEPCSNRFTIAIDQMVSQVLLSEVGFGRYIIGQFAM